MLWTSQPLGLTRENDRSKLSAIMLNNVLSKVRVQTKHPPYLWPTGKKYNSMPLEGQDADIFDQYDYVFNVSNTFTTLEYICNLSD